MVLMKKEERSKKLSAFLTEQEIKELGYSFDQVGDIMIVDIPDSLKKKKKQIGKFMLDNYKTAKVICMKKGMHSGTFRTRPLEVIAGEKRKETVHTESGTKLKLNVEKVYFSPRLSTERLRIAEQIKSSEKVLVLFSGCAPYVCVIGKKAKPEKIVGIEINPVAHEYALENIKNNKVKADLYLGDVREVLPKLKEKFDRIIMPLPKNADEFLGVAFKAAKKGTIIYLYDFLDKKEIPDKTLEKIGRECKRARKKYKIISWRKCGQFSPSTFRVVVDFMVV